MGNKIEVEPRLIRPQGIYYLGGLRIFLSQNKKQANKLKSIIGVIT